MSRQCRLLQRARQSRTPVCLRRQRLQQRLRQQRLRWCRPMKRNLLLTRRQLSPLLHLCQHRLWQRQQAQRQRCKRRPAPPRRHLHPTPFQPTALTLRLLTRRRLAAQAGSGRPWRQRSARFRPEASSTCWPACRRARPPGAPHLWRHRQRRHWRPRSQRPSRQRWLSLLQLARGAAATAASQQRRRRLKWRWPRRRRSARRLLAPQLWRSQRRFSTVRGQGGLG